MQQNYNILNDFSPDKYNLLVPVQSLQEVNPIYRIITNVVHISNNSDDGEIYKETGANKINNQEMYALTAKGLMKLSTAANGQIVESVKVRPKTCEKCIDIVKATQKAPSCGNCPCAANVAFQVIMKFPEMSGGWRIVQATKEIDFSALTGKKDSQIAKIKEFAAEQAETKAMSRCIRKALTVKNAYTLKELEKPFVVAYPVLNANDHDVKKALIAGAVASSNLLYGTKLELQAPKTQALPSGEHVDTSTGEIYEADYSVEKINYEEQSSNQQTYCCNNPQCKASLSNADAQSCIQQFGQPLCNRCKEILTNMNGGQV